MLALVPFPPGCSESDVHVDHINGDTLDGRLCNLQWLTVAQHNSKSVWERAGHQPGMRRSVGLNTPEPS